MTQKVETQGTYRLPDTLADDLEKLRQMVEQLKAGALAPERFRAFRVPMGVYEQRESGTFMLRVRLPAGGVLPHQMRALADVARRYSNGVLHVTTRQDIQVHRVPLESIHPALIALYEAGLATKGGGGNTVRNITACPRSGVCPNEVFDVTPHAIALTEFLLPDPLSFQLPRKYKIAFSGCRDDCAGATVNDLGLIAKRRDGVLGSAAYVGGGMGAHSRVADLLEEFVPASDIHLVAEAIKRVFDKHGNRKSKHKARLRFLIEQIGLDAFRGLYEKELAELRKAPPPCPELRPLPRPDHTSTPTAGPGPTGRPEDFDAWRAHNVSPQKQEGYKIVEIALFLGDINAGDLSSLADVVERHGERMLRTTQQQNLVLRWVRDNELGELHGELSALALADAPPAVLRNLVACAGASTCTLGICLSRGLASAVADALSCNALDLAALGDLKIHISGCPNSCGRHPVADIGLFGAARRVKGRLVPHYVVQLGGRVAEGETRLAEGKATVPARNAPSFLKGFLKAFSRSPQCPDFHAFLEDGGRRLARDLLVEWREIPGFEIDKNCYFDWGADEIFSLAGRGPGECSAGVFDLIEVDLASASEALGSGRHYAAAALAARALLITRGEQPESDLEAFHLFREHFVEQGLIDRRFEVLLASAIQSAAAQDPEESFDASRHDVAALVRAVQALYETMDDSLRFPAPASPASTTARPSAEAAADVAKNFRGVACPLNYVKTKLALEEMEAGEVLSILVGEDGAQNVPASAAADGHQVLSVTQEGDRWRILIRKCKGNEQ